MLNIIHKSNGQLKLHRGNINELLIDNILWIDLFKPSSSEKEIIEKLFNIKFLTQIALEEIEASSKFIETEDTIINNSTFLTVIDNELHTETISLIIKNNVLFTYRNIDLMTFNETFKRILNSTKYNDAFSLLLLIYEIRIDLDADMIESLFKEIINFGRIKDTKSQITSEIIYLSAKYQEQAMMIREILMEKHRILSYLTKSDLIPSIYNERITTMLRDVSSLLNYTDFCFVRLDYIQNNILNLINLEQNKVIKIFTVVTVLLMPPTLIASIYGMNFHYMPELSWKFGYPLSLLLMALSILFGYIYLKVKKWI